MTEAVELVIRMSDITLTEEVDNHTFTGRHSQWEAYLSGPLRTRDGGEGETVKMARFGDSARLAKAALVEAIEAEGWGLE